MTNAPYVWTGGCACGAVRFEVQGRRVVVGDCHCRMCQRSVGAGAVAWATLRRERLTIVRGEPRWWRSSAVADRGFCGDCGASLFFRALTDAPLLDVIAVAFDHPGALAPSFAIWIGSRQPWVHLDPSLPAYEGAGPDWDPVAAMPAPPPEEGLRWQEGGPVDAVQVARLFEAVGFSQRNDPAFLQAAIDGARWVITVWRGPLLVGFARAISDGVSNAYISAVAVRPDHQGQGLGRALMQRLMGGRESVKFVLQARPEVQGLYRSLGYVDATEMLVRGRAG